MSNMSNTSEGSHWISLAEAQSILGISRNTLKKLIREGTLPAYTIEGVVGYKVKRSDVEALIKPVVVERPKKKKHAR